MDNVNLIVILGPTASGKTHLATRLAKFFDTEIISADSRQIFKGMDIGTGKDLAEYIVDGVSVRHHLIDIKEAGEKYHVNAFKEDFYAAFNTIREKGKIPILCGGTGMYVHSILQNYAYTAVPINEVLREQLLKEERDVLLNMFAKYPDALKAHADITSTKRLIRVIEIAEFLSHNEFVAPTHPTINPIVIGLQNDVVQRRDKILVRLKKRLQEGLIGEVEQLLANGVSKEMLAFYGLEYKFVSAYLAGELTYSELEERLGVAICQFAKRQMTFFRKMEKDGVSINWLNAAADPNCVFESSISLLKDINFSSAKS